VFKQEFISRPEDAYEYISLIRIMMGGNTPDAMLVTIPDDPGFISTIKTLDDLLSLSPHIFFQHKNTLERLLGK